MHANFCFVMEVQPVNLLEFVIYVFQIIIVMKPLTHIVLVFISNHSEHVLLV